MSSKTECSGVLWERDFGRIASINAAGICSTQVYDVVGRGVASINLKRNRWTTVYNVANQSIALVDTLGRRSSSLTSNLPEK